MKRLSKVFILATLVGVVLTAISLRPGGFLATTELGHLLVLLSSSNLDRFEVKVGEGLSADVVDVYWTEWDARFKSPALRIIHNGYPDQLLPRTYGGNEFSVFYAGKPILGKHSQFKLASWHYHSYKVKVLRSPDGQLSSHISSVGADRLFSAPLVPSFASRISVERVLPALDTIGTQPVLPPHANQPR